MSESETKLTPSNRKFYLLVAAFLLAAVGVGVLSARRSGATELERYKAELRAKGEKLTFAELMPDGASTNWKRGSIEDLARIGAALEATNRVIERLELIHHFLDGTAEPIWARTNLLAVVGLTTATLPTAIEWTALERSLEDASALLKEATALVSSPESHAGMNYGYVRSLPQYQSGKFRIARWLAAVHASHLRAGRLREAVATHQTVMQVIRWHGEELTMYDLQTRARLATIGLIMTWSSMSHRSLADGDLRHLITEWAGLTLATNHSRAIEVQRAAGQHSFQQVHNHGLTSLFGGTPHKAADTVYRVVSGDADEMFQLRTCQSALELAREAERKRSFVAVQAKLSLHEKQVESALQSSMGRVRLQVSMTSGVMEITESGVQRFYRFETRRELTLAALALELHRRKHGRHPESFSGLVPEFLPAVPVDWMDGQPLRYRLNSDGSFALWSVGDNLTDDGGDAFGPPVNMRRNDIWEGRDAVWPRPPP